MKYKVGDKVRIKSIDWYNRYTNGTEVDCGAYPFTSDMKEFCGQERIIANVCQECYVLLGIDDKFVFTDEMIECKVEEETKPEPKFKVGDKITNGTVTFTILTLASDRYFVEDNFGGYGTLYFKTRDDWKLVEEKTSIKLTGKAIKNEEMVVSINEYALPEGYIFKDENGNVINATKIVLEKKKKEYPKTYEECCKIMQVARPFMWFNYSEVNSISQGGDEYERHMENTLCVLRRLLICRDAYWKIAGEEMGLGKPWEPDFDNLSTNLEYMKIDKGCFTYSSRVFVFPTEEMRDAFKENFDPDIEICKEFL